MSETPNGNGNGAVARRGSDPLGQMQVFLKTREKALAQYVAGRLKPDTLIKLALLEFSQNDKLRRCSAQSIYSALITSAQLGLEPGKAKGEAYLVPYGSECTLIPGYKGLIKLALRSKGVKSIYSHLVYERDEFVIELGSEPRVVHRPCLEDDRGNILGCYAIAHLENGSIDVEWMGYTQLERVREASASKNSPAYKDWGDEMYRKAPIRRLSKRLPLGDDFFEAVARDEAHEEGKPPPKFEIGEEPADAEVVDGPPATAQNANGGGLRDRVRQAANSGE